MSGVCSICEARVGQKDFLALDCELPDCRLCGGIFARESEIVALFQTANYDNISDLFVSVKLEGNKGNFATGESDVRIFSVKDALKLRLRGKLADASVGRAPASALLPAVNLEISSSGKTLRVQTRRDSVFLVGQYVKRSRCISQSKWFANSDTKPETSIEELIIDAVYTAMGLERLPAATEAKNFRFSASGREDMDVRMLGEGRTFCMEISDLRNFRGLLEYDADSGVVKFPLTCLLTDIHTDKYSLTQFRLAEKTFVKFLATAAETHQKRYACVVHSSVVLPEDVAERAAKVQSLEIAQSTPIRTLQRRANAVRKKTLYELTVSRLNDHFAYAVLTTSAGMYIKEFVHSDFGRTQPSLAQVLELSGAQMDILQLDVLGVQDEDTAAYPGQMSAGVST